MENQISDLPENVQRTLQDFTESAKVAIGSNLKSIVLYGSAAEGRLRPTSDVNLILIFNDFQISQINDIREKLRVAYAAINLNVMFLMESEIPIATEAFAVKFTDVLHRHKVLFGADVFKSLNISRAATLQRLKQVIINLNLRLRERYALISLREEQLVMVIADATGPIRACAATILGLEGKSAPAPKEALLTLTRQLPGKEWAPILANMSTAREERELKPGEAASTLIGLLDLLQAMHKHVQGLR